MNREGFHDWRREYERKTIICIGALCVGARGMQQEARRGDDPGTNDGSSDNSCPDGACDVF